MKRILVVAFMLCAPSAFAGTPEHFFDSLALHPNVPQAPAYTPPILPPIFSVSDINNSAQLMANVNANVGTYTDLLKKHDFDLYSPSGSVAIKFASLPAGPPGPQGPQGIPGPTGIGVTGPPGPSGVSANTPAYDAAGLTNVTLATQGGSFCWPNTRLGNISRGATADRAVTISAGAHTLSVCVASNNAGISMHAEIPAGTNVTGTIKIPNTGGWSGGNYVWVSAPLTLTGPATSVHLVFDTGGLDFGGF